MRDLIARAGGLDAGGAVLFRKNGQMSTNANMDPYALRAWCWRVLATANEDPPAVEYRRGTTTLEFLTRIAKFSRLEDGPKQARELMAEQGIPPVIAEYLPKTYLDGAALRLPDGRTVIGLTLRYDRIDDFWFCLLHELAHRGRHMDTDGGGSFCDDLNLRKHGIKREDPKETQADEWAEEALVRRAIWEASTARDRPSATAVTALANELQVHPAVVAGKIRYERRNYRLPSQFVGTGQIRKQFGPGRMATVR